MSLANTYFHLIKVCLQKARLDFICNQCNIYVFIKMLNAKDNRRQH